VSGFPAGVVPVSVTGTNCIWPDGVGWDGTVCFTPSQLLVDVTDGAIIGGSGLGVVVSGTMSPVQLVPTDCAVVAPSPFTYTVTARITHPEGQEEDLAFSQVSIPASLGPVVELLKVLQP
jgi:hypothetical protein